MVASSIINNKFSSINFGTISLIFLIFFAWFVSYFYLYVFEIGGPKPLYSYILFLLFSLFAFSLQSCSRNKFLLPLNNSNSLRLAYYWLAVYIIYLYLQGLRNASDPAAIQVLISGSEMVLLT